MTDYDIVVRLADGTEITATSDTVLEGETDEHLVTVTNPKVEVSSTQQSGN